MAKYILAHRPHPEQGFRSCLGIIRLGRRYGSERVEAACRRALAIQSYSYRSVKSILKNGLDGAAAYPDHHPDYPCAATRTCAAPPITVDEEALMLTTPTLDKLRTLGLTAMAAAFAEQLERADLRRAQLRRSPRLMVDREADARDSRRLAAIPRRQAAIGARVEDIDFRRSRGLDRSVVLSLAEAEWVTGHRNVLIVGATGLGKTFIACALANAAIRRAHTALYVRTPRLLDELALARADGLLPRLMARWAKIDVLIVDDLALRPLAPEQAADLLEVIEDRYQLRSTIVTPASSPVSDWR